MYHIIFKKKKKRKAFERRHNWACRSEASGPRVGLSCSPERVIPVLEGIRGLWYPR